MKTNKKLLFLFSLFLLIFSTSCRKDDNIQQKSKLQLKKDILMSKTWYQSNKLCPDEGYHLNFSADSVTQTNYQTFDYVTWYNSSNKGAYILMEDSIKINRLFHYFGENTFPYHLTEDSLIIYPSATSYFPYIFVYLSKPIYGKP